MRQKTQLYSPREVEERKMGLLQEDSQEEERGIAHESHFRNDGSEVSLSRFEHDGSTVCYGPSDFLQNGGAMEKSATQCPGIM